MKTTFENGRHLTLVLKEKDSDEIIANLKAYTGTGVSLAAQIQRAVIDHYSLDSEVKILSDETITLENMRPVEFDVEFDEDGDERVETLTLEIATLYGNDELDANQDLIELENLINKITGKLQTLQDGLKAMIELKK